MCQQNWRPSPPYKSRLSLFPCLFLAQRGDSLHYGDQSIQTKSSRLCLNDITVYFFLQERTPYTMGTRGFKQNLENDFNVDFLLRKRSPYIMGTRGFKLVPLVCFFSALFVCVSVPFTLSVSYLLKFSFLSRVVPPLTGARPVHRVLATALELTVRHQAACHLTLKDLH